jgi:hypothetical protein
MRQQRWPREHIIARRDERRLDRGIYTGLAPGREFD